MNIEFKWATIDNNCVHQTVKRRRRYLTSIGNVIDGDSIDANQILVLSFARNRTDMNRTDVIVVNQANIMINIRLVLCL